MRISQGTVSVLVGCHSPVHAIFVIKAWKEVHGRWPKPWEIGCILLHDIGHIGLNYIDNQEEKDKHWFLGAKIAHKLFGDKGYYLVAGHTSASSAGKSDLYLPDKHSWAMAPRWWIIWQSIVEPELRGGKGIFEHADAFMEWAQKNVNSDEVRDTHNAIEELKKK